MRHLTFGGPLVAVVLAGCVAAGGLGGGSSQPVLQGAMRMAPPAGYCIDPASLRDADDRAVALMGRCSAQSPAHPAVLSLSIGPAASAGVMAGGGAELAGFFTSAEGRARLAPSGKAEDIRVIEALSVDDAFLMRVEDRGAPSYWRAVLGLRGRLVTLSVQGSPGAVLPPEDGRAIIEKALAAMRRANKS